MIIEPIECGKKVNTIVFSFDEKYAKYFSVTLLSLINCCDSEYAYDLVVLYDDLSNETQEKLIRLLPDSFSLRFYNVSECASEYFGDYSGLIDTNKWTVSTFYDLLVPLIMPAYEKVLYSDSDLVFCKDLKELFSISFEGKPMIAVRDNFALTWELHPDNSFLEKQEMFLKEKLEIDDYTDYFNTGIILFNIHAIDKDEYLRAIQHALSFPELPTVDQDVLNYVFKGNVTYAPVSFNLQAPIMRELREYNDYRVRWPYYSGVDDPTIIHYTTDVKPWKSPECEMNDIFWKSARLSPFVDEIIDDGMNKITSSYKYPKLKLIVSGIMSKIFHGSWDCRFHKARQINKILKYLHYQKTKS